MAEETTKPTEKRSPRALLCDIFGLTGAGLLSFGAWQVYEPAGFIVLGLLLLSGAIYGARSL